MRLPLWLHRLHLDAPSETCVGFAWAWLGRLGRFRLERTPSHGTETCGYTPHP